MSYFQANNLGCPQYQYFRNGNLITAQVAIPGGRVLVGKSCFSKEEASESAANAALRHLTNQTNLSPNKPKSPKTFPTPPKQWYKNATSSTSSTSKGTVSLSVMQDYSSYLNCDCSLSKQRILHKYLCRYRQ